MTKSVSILLATTALGCSLYAKPILNDGTTLGYAYIKNGKVLKVSINKEKPSDNIELIRITSGGFYPDYELPKETRNYDCGSHKTANGELACKSMFVTRSGSDLALSAVGNLFAPLISAAEQKMAYADSKSFDKNEFLTFVSEHQLEKYRDKLLQLAQLQDDVKYYALEKNKKLQEMYDVTQKDYKENIKNIDIKYLLKDNSGLWSKQNIDADYSLEMMMPDRKQYNYEGIIQENKYSQATDSFSLQEAKQAKANVKMQIDEQYEKDVKEYKEYLSSNFKNYKLIGNSSKTFALNDNISFYATIKAPIHEISYTLGKKITINIPVTIEYVNIKGMVPKEYTLQDANFNMLMRADSGLRINGIMSNKTQSFLTVKSLTSYYQGLVFNVSNLDKELAPEARDLDDGTRYSLITSSMSEKSNFEKITKSKAEAIKINYGYAVKYKINDTNIEKAIYNTKNYSLYDIIQQYL